MAQQHIRFGKKNTQRSKQDQRHTTAKRLELRVEQHTTPKSFSRIGPGGSLYSSPIFALNATCRKKIIPSDRYLLISLREN